MGQPKLSRSPTTEITEANDFKVKWDAAPI